MENKMMMVGVVSAIYPESARARVIFPDRDDMTSKELSVTFERAKGVEVYAMPNVGEEVVCMFLPNGLEEGFIIGAYYNDKNKPPVVDSSIKIIKFENGDYVQYQNGVFTFKGNVVINGNVTVSGNVTAPIFTGDLKGTADKAKVIG